MRSKPGITKQSQGQGTHHRLQVWELNRDIHGRHPLALKIVQHIHLHAQAIEKNRKINQNTNKPKELKQAAGYCNDKMITTEASP